jgi:hypothetical protein
MCGNFQVTIALQRVERVARHAVLDLPFARGRYVVW